MLDAPVQDVRDRVWVVITKVVNGTTYYLLGKRSSECKNPGKWNFFGGVREDGETSRFAATRELKEETYLVVAPEVLFLHLSTQYKDRVIHWYTVDYYNVVGLDRPLMVTLETDDYEWVRPNTYTPEELHYSAREFFLRADLPNKRV